MQQAHIFVSGFVQGVGFRQFVRQKAREYGVTGWVSNFDRRVEGVFQGKKDSVEKLIAACKKGPFLAEVEEVIATWEEESESYKDFVIRK